MLQTKKIAPKQPKNHLCKYKKSIEFPSLALPKEVGQVLHGVGPQTGDVAVPARRGVLLAQGGDSEGGTVNIG